MQKIDSTGTTRYLYDGASIIAETNSAGAITVYDTPGIGFTTGIGTYYFLPDGIGNNSGIVDSGQFQADTYWYFAYGQTTVYHQGFYTPYKFEGKHGYYADGDSGMVLLGARYYLPTTHGFLTQDPKGQDAGLNMYLYAENNPLSKVDPTGLDDDHTDEAIRGAFTSAFTAIGAFGGGVAGGTGGSVVPVAGTALGVGVGAGGGALGGAAIGRLVGEAAVGLRHLSNYLFSSGSGPADDDVPTFPELPEGMSKAGVGRLIGWGQGEEGTINKLNSLTDKDIEAMKERGLTKDLAQQIGNFYRDFGIRMARASRRGTLNTPELRSKLMYEIVQRWPKE